MTPGLPQPDPLPLPAPVWFLQAWLLLTFLLHALAMNLLLGGAILAAVARVRARSSPHGHDGELARRWAAALPVLFAATVTLGVAALLFLQVLYGRLFFASSVVMAWAWLSVIFLLIAAYYGAYALAFQGTSSSRCSAALAGAVAVVLIGVGVIYSTNMSVMLRPDELAARYHADPRGLHLALGDPALVPRFLHMLLGAVAVSGLATALGGLGVRSRAPAFGTWAVRRGSVWFVAATMLNVLVGFWWLGALPRPTIEHLVGGADPAAGAVLAAGVAAGVAAVALMIGGMASPRPAPFVRGGAAAAVLSVACMVVTRDHVRRAAIEAAGFAPASWVAPQWGAIVLFAVLLAAAGVTLAWMIRQLVLAARAA